MTRASAPPRTNRTAGSLAFSSAVIESSLTPRSGRAVEMEYVDRAAEDAYSAHPDHVSFVSERWDNEVTDFLELDSEAL